MPEPQFTDFEVSDTGGLALFEPLTLDAIDFAQEAFADALTWGNAYVVERAYAMGIVFDLVRQQGFIVSIDGHVVSWIEEV